MDICPVQKLWIMQLHITEVGQINKQTRNTYRKNTQIHNVISSIVYILGDAWVRNIIHTHLVEYTMKLNKYVLSLNLWKPSAKGSELQSLGTVTVKDLPSVDDNRNLGTQRSSEIEDRSEREGI